MHEKRSNLTGVSWKWKKRSNLTGVSWKWGTRASFLLGSLSNNVFERRTSTGSGLFSFFDGGFAQIFSQITSITVKKLRNTNFTSSRHVKRENTSLSVDVRRSKPSLLKLPNIYLLRLNRSRCRRRRCCWSSILLWSRNFTTMVTWRHNSPLFYVV